MEEIIRQCNTEREQYIISFLKLYKKGEFLYPSVLIRNTKISSDTAIMILNKLADAGILQRKREYRCYDHMNSYVITDDVEQEEVLCRECDKVLEDYSYFYVFI